jgi:DNA-binding IclR family transcriptional regulator
VDSPDAPRAQPLNVGFDDAAHASAYGKVVLAYMSTGERREYLSSFGLSRLTGRTITRLEELEDELAEVRAFGSASEIEEFQPSWPASQHRFATPPVPWWLQSHRPRRSNTSGAIVTG